MDPKKNVTGEDQCEDSPPAYPHGEANEKKKKKKKSSKLSIKDRVNNYGKRRVSESSHQVEAHITAHDVKRYNVLVVGESGTGKSTFIQVLKDIRHKPEANLYRQTIEPNIEDVLFSINGEFASLTIIDTPGFNEASGTARSNEAIKRLILDFVKKGVTTLDLVLIAIPGARRITATQLSGFVELLNFLGPTVNKRTAILCTHAENFDTKAEKQFKKDLKKNPHMKVVYKSCKKGVLYTGALSYNESSTVARDLFAIRQKARIATFFDKTCGGEPVTLIGDKLTKTKQHFAVYESAAKDSLTLKDLLPQLTSLATKVVQDREGVSLMIAERQAAGRDEEKSSTTESAIALVDSLKDISTASFKKSAEECNKILQLLSEYESIGKRINKKALETSADFDELSKAASELDIMCLRLTQGGVDESDSDSDSDSGSDSDSKSD